MPKKRKKKNNPPNNNAVRLLLGCLGEEVCGALCEGFRKDRDFGVIIKMLDKIETWCNTAWKLLV